MVTVSAQAFCFIASAMVRAVLVMPSTADDFERPLGNKSGGFTIYIHAACGECGCSRKKTGTKVKGTRGEMLELEKLVGER